MQHIHCVQSPLPCEGDEAAAAQITQLSKISYKRWTSGVHETVMAVVSLNRKTSYCTFDTSVRSCSWIMRKRASCTLKTKSSSHQRHSSGGSQKALTKIHWKKECKKYNKTVHKKLKQRHSILAHITGKQINRLFTQGWEDKAVNMRCDYCSFRRLM